MAKYCKTVKLEPCFNASTPLLGCSKDKLVTCLTDDICTHAPKVGVCDPCDTLKGSSCVPGCSSYSRYSKCDWELAYNANYAQADKERMASERLRADGWTAVQQADKQTHDRQCRSTKHIGERVYEIAFWKESILTEMRIMETESNNLEECIRVLEKTLCEAKIPQAIIEESLLQREKRLGIECVHDDVERGLCKELEIIKVVQEKIKAMIQKANCQLKRNRASQLNLELDVKDKSHAQGIEDRAHQLNNSSCRISFFPGVENEDNTITDIDGWIRYTQLNISASQAERERSEVLRHEIECFLRSVFREMWNQYNIVNSALLARVQEITDARNRLQYQLERINNEVRDTDRLIQLLRRSINDKENSLKVAQTRLDEKSRRRCIELSRDTSMIALTNEVHELYVAVCRLKEKLRQAENTMCRLLQARISLENDISIKDAAVQIDQAFVLGLRKKMPMDPRMGPMLVLPHLEC